MIIQVVLKYVEAMNIYITILYVKNAQVLCKIVYLVILLPTVWVVLLVFIEHLKFL